jgi:hypothetical protein
VLQPQAIVETVEPIIEDPVNHPIQTVEMPTLPTNKHSPTAIPFEDDELDDTSVICANDIPPPRRYNLCSHAHHIIQSTIDDGLVIPQNHIAFAVVDEETGRALEY